MNSGQTSANKVLHLINGEHYAGAERVQDLLSARLPEFGYLPHFACLKPGHFPERATVPADRLHLFPMRGRLDFGVLRGLSTLIRRENFVLIHSHTPRTAMIGAALSLRHGLPLVHHQHSPSTRESLRGLKDKAGAAMETLAVRRAARIIAVSKQIEDYCREMGFRADRIVLVHNGVPPSPTPRPAGPPGDPIRLAVVALFRERKGLEIAIEAIARSTARAELEVIGGFVSQAYEARVRALAVTLGVEERVHWRGPTADIYGALAQVDGFVLPSLYGEGLPMVLLEAMAAGLAIFAADVEGVSDAIPDAGFGTVFPAGDVAALAQAIGAYAQDPSPLVAGAQAARTRQLAHFSDVAMARGTARTYDAALVAR